MSYVYVITVDGIDRYVGKGNGRRLHVHLQRARSLNAARTAGVKTRASQFHNRLAKALRDDANIECRILVDGLSDQDAFVVEAAEIVIRRDSLWNILAGGSGGFPSNLWADPTTRAQVHAFLSSSENKQRASQHTTALWANPDTRARMTASLTAAANRPQNKARLSTEMKARHKTLMAGYKVYLATPEGKAMRQQQMRDVWSSGQRKRAAPKPPADRSGKLKRSWATRNEKRDTMVLTLCQRPEGATPRELYAVIGRRHTALLTSFVERGLIKRIGGYHNGRYHANE